jgi:two-component system response regulator DesR
MIVGGYSVEAGRPLSPRMRDVVRSASRGGTTASTALELGVTEATVKSIRSAALGRLGVSTIAAAVLEASKRGEL